MSWRGGWQDDWRSGPYDRDGGGYGKSRGKGRSEWAGSQPYAAASHNPYGHQGYGEQPKGSGKGLPLTQALATVQAAIREQHALSQLSRVFAADSHPGAQMAAADCGGLLGGLAAAAQQPPNLLPPPSSPPGVWCGAAPADSAGSKLVSAAATALSQAGATLGGIALQALSSAMRTATGGLSGDVEARPTNLLERVGAALNPRPPSTGPGSPTTPMESPPTHLLMEEIKRLREENERLAGQSRPRAAAPATEVYDARDVDLLVERALTKALKEDAVRGRRRERIVTPSPRRSERGRSSSPRRTGQRDEDDEVALPAAAAEHPTPRREPSSAAVEAPEYVSPAMHAAFFGWIGVKATIRERRARTQWLADVAKRYSVANWHDHMKKVKVTGLPQQRGPLLERILEEFLRRYPEWGEATSPR